MTVRLTHIVAVVLTALAGWLNAASQEYRFDTGAALGVAGYLGDLNESNMFKHPGLAGGFLFRYVQSSRWAFKGNLLYARLSGDSRDVKNKFVLDEPIKFSSNVVDLSATVEFNFLHFGMGPRYKNYKRVSPYMVLGLGMVVNFGKGFHGVALTLPMGVGVKYKLKERLNLGFEFTMRKDFGDALDGLTDLRAIKHGFAKNTDWHALALFTVTYEFSKRCVKCHYVE